LDQSVEIPTKFTLLLSETGRLHRNCQIAWRVENQIGVEFLPDAPADTPTHPERPAILVG
jgi:hypothetical protein